MATIYVSKAGSDANSGATLALAKLTIGAARTLAASGDTVLVSGSTSTPYFETVAPAAGVTFKGAPGERPCIDGQFTRDHGFYTQVQANLVNCRIEGFEVRNCLRAGIYISGTQGVNTGLVINDCWVHHIISSQPIVNAIYLGFGNARVTNCEIGHIAGKNETIAIWMWRNHNAVIDSNLIYIVRKSCIREATGLSNTITNNQMYRAWSGGECSVGVGGLWANNVIGFCDWGFWMKHCNQNGLAIWGLTADTAPAKYRFWHNTIYRPLEAGMSIGGDAANGGYTRDFSIKNNIFVGGGDTAPFQVGGANVAKAAESYVFASPTTILDGAEVDFNAYATAASGFNRPAELYREGTSTPFVTKELLALQTDKGWELNGADLNPQLIDPVNLNFDYLDTSPVKNMGAALASAWGNQMGARGLIAPRIRYTPHNLMGHSKTWSAGVWLGMFDQKSPSSSSWTFTAGTDAVIIDLGSTKNVTHFFYYPLGGTGAARGHRWETSSTASGPWTVQIEGDYVDNGLTTYWEEIPGGGTQCRYLRYTFLTNWSTTGLTGNTGGTELGAAYLAFAGEPPPSGGGEDPPPDPPPDDPPPAPPPSPVVADAYLGLLA